LTNILGKKLDGKLSRKYSELGKQLYAYMLNKRHFRVLYHQHFYNTKFKLT